MKTFLSVVLIAVFCSFFAHADQSPVVPASPAQLAPVVPSVAAPASITPLPTAPAMVAVAEPAAPPKWAADVIVTIQKLPIVGPIASKAIMYLGILVSLLTGLVGFLLTTLNALKGVLNIAGIAEAVEKIEDFKNGKIMYWLKYLSMFNASKPESKPTA